VCIQSSAAGYFKAATCPSRQERLWSFWVPATWRRVASLCFINQGVHSDHTSSHTFLEERATLASCEDGFASADGLHSAREAPQDVEPRYLSASLAQNGARDIASSQLSQRGRRVEPSVQAT
jgi:hypothetical protein